MPATVTAGASFRAGLRSELLGTYKRMYESIRPRLEVAMGLDFPSDKRSEYYFYWESAPHMARWAYGNDMSEEGFKGIQFEVLNHRWAKAISWQSDDRADDQTRSLLDHARGLGESAALLDERVLWQIIEGTTDAQLLPTIPNAPDGTALHSGSGNARFGETNGNTTVVALATTDATARTGFWTAIGQMRGFQDIQGQPLLDPGAIDGPKLIAFEPGAEDSFTQAFLRELVNDGGTAGAGASNEILAAGHKVTLWSTQRCATTHHIVFLGGAIIKSVFSQLREGMGEVVATNQNSDLARQRDEESIRFKVRKGYGVALPYATMEWAAS